MPTRPILRSGACVTLFALALATPLRAETLKVPSQDYPTIQSAVSDAANGDVIVVGKGVYLETVSVFTNELTLVGKNAVIDAGFEDHCITAAARDLTISGFTLVNGTAGVGDNVPDFAGFTEPHRLEVRDCVIRSCIDGIDITAETPTITRNLIRDCSGTGILIDATDSDEPAVITRNVVMRCADGMSIEAHSATLERNAVLACTGDGIAAVLGGEFEFANTTVPSSVVRNRVSGALGAGVDIRHSQGTEVRIEKNRLNGNGLGLRAVGEDFDIVANECSRNAGIGMLLGDAEISHFANSEARDNTARDNGTDGIRVDGPLLCRLPSPPGQIHDNRSQGNGRDGIAIGHSHEDVFADNVCKANGGEGIDIENDVFDDIVLTGNVCTQNAHEGIDNSGDGTLLSDNVCTGNARGVGPDIAGTGKGGIGSAIDLGGNVFKTGGFEVASRVDIDA